MATSPKPAGVSKKKPDPGSNDPFGALIKSASSGKGSAPPPTGKSSNGADVAMQMFRQFGPGWIKNGYAQTVIYYARLYKIPPPYLAALFLTENTSADPSARSSAGALGLAQILDKNLNNYNNDQTFTWGQGNTLGVGQVITDKMKLNPVFSIAYAAWRLSGELTTYGSLKAAYQQGYHGPNPDGSPVPNPDKWLPGNYQPTKTDWSPSGVPTKTANQPASHVTDPYVTIDRKTGRIGKTINPSDPGIVEFEGFPITYSVLRRELQDKQGLGADVYSLTGKTPSASQLAWLMSSGKTIQQIENTLIDSKFFPSSPTGQKYVLDYQDSWSRIMGNNSKVPLDWVRDAAKKNLTQGEFETRIRQSSEYLKSNEFSSKLDEFTNSYQKIYGDTMKDTNAQVLAKDAALAGWDTTQWESYLRSQPGYVKTPEYKSAVLSVLDKLGLTFGMIPTLNPHPTVAQPANPETPIAGPGGDKRVNKGNVPSNVPAPNDLTSNLGIQF